MELYCNNQYLVSLDGEIYSQIVKRMIESVGDLDFDKVVSVEARGWLYGPIVANHFSKPFVPLLKGGKIGNRDFILESDKYVDYSKRAKSLEIFKSSIDKGDKILLVDDSYETGNTARICISLIEKFGGDIKGIAIAFNDLNKENEDFFENYNFKFVHRLKDEYRDKIVDVFNLSSENTS